MENEDKSSKRRPSIYYWCHVLSIFDEVRSNFLRNDSAKSRGHRVIKES